MRFIVGLLLTAIVTGSVAALWVSVNCVIWWTPAHGVCRPQWQEARAPAASPEVKPLTADEIAPSFDVVRAEATGDLVIAGRAEPRSRITVESDGTPIGSTVADAAGEWVFQPERPLPRGEHSLGLFSEMPAAAGAGASITGAKPGRRLASRQRVAISLGAGGKDRPLVALSEEGRPTRILQRAPDAIAADSPQAGKDGAQPGTAETAAPQREAAIRALAFESLDFDEDSAADGGTEGTFFARGRALPGARVGVYIDNALAGFATADAGGGWQFSGRRGLAAGSHAVRADHVDEGGAVTARAEVSFERDPPAQQVAAAERDARDREVKAAAERDARDRKAKAAAERDARDREAKAAAERDARDREAKAAAERDARDREAKAAAERDARDREAKAAAERDARDREAKAAAERDERDREAKAAAERDARDREAKAAAERDARDSEAKAAAERRVVEARAAAATQQPLAETPVSPALPKETPSASPPALSSDVERAPAARPEAERPPAPRSQAEQAPVPQRAQPAPQPASSVAPASRDAQRAADTPRFVRSSRRRAGLRRRPRYVLVREGDTLWQISERFYGRGPRYTKIFRSNRSQIADPDLIYPDQRFRVPR